MEERCILGMASLSVRHLIQPHVNVSVQPEKANLVKVLEELIHQPGRDPLAIQGEKIWQDTESPQCRIRP